MRTTRSRTGPNGSCVAALQVRRQRGGTRETEDPRTRDRAPPLDGQVVPVERHVASGGNTRNGGRCLVPRLRDREQGQPSQASLLPDRERQEGRQRTGRPSQRHQRASPGDEEDDERRQEEAVGGLEPDQIPPSTPAPSADPRRPFRTARTEAQAVASTATSDGKSAMSVRPAQCGASTYCSNLGR